MKILLLTFSVVLFLVVVGVGEGSCADVVGTVTDLAGTSISGAVITAKDTTGQVLGQSVANAQGHYNLSGLAPGHYQYFLKVSPLGFKDGSAATVLGPDGLTIDWKVSNQNPAVAMATKGTSTSTGLAGDPFGYSPGEFASRVGLGVMGIAAGVVGGYGAAGGFNGGGHAASPGHQRRIISSSF
jgi:hypothetical protein